LGLKIGENVGAADVGAADVALEVGAAVIGASVVDACVGAVVKAVGWREVRLVVETTDGEAVRAEVGLGVEASEVAVGVGGAVKVG